MSDAATTEPRVAPAPTDSTPSHRAPSPRWPAFVPRRGLFVLLLVVYLIVLAGLIAMSVAQHERPRRSAETETLLNR